MKAVKSFIIKTAAREIDPKKQKWGSLGPPLLCPIPLYCASLVRVVSSSSWLVGKLLENISLLLKK